jgi:RNA polymerase sigma-70 factor (ECF subfamily)
MNLSPPTDEILSSSKRGESSGQMKLYHWYHDTMYRFAYGMLNDNDEAISAFHDAFMVLCAKIQETEITNINMYMRTLVRNACLDRIEKKKKDRLKLTEPEDKCFEGPTVSTDTSHLDDDIILKQLDKLPLMERTVFLLYNIEGMSYEEIADRLNINILTSRSYLHKAKLKLREEYKKINQISNITSHE